MRPCVINADKHASNRPATAELPESGELGRPCKCRPCSNLATARELEAHEIPPLAFYRTLGQGLPTRNAGLVPLRGAYFCARPVRTSAV